MKPIDITGKFYRTAFPSEYGKEPKWHTTKKFTRNTGAEL